MPLARDGGVEELGGCAQLELAAGEALEVLTPGGGGYGPPVCIQRREAKRPSLCSSLRAS